MSTTMKVLLGIAGFFVLCIGLVGWKAYSWWHANGQAYVAAVKTAGEDGKLFGRTADNDACVKSAMDRFATDTTTLGALQATIYVQDCLPESKPTQGFCDGVPAPKDFAAVREWEKGKCATMSATTDRPCRMAIAPVPRFCHPRDSGNG